MKKFILALVFMMIMTIPVANASFSDVSGNYDYYPAVNYMKEQGFVQGYGDGTYKPDNKISRAEFTKIIIGARFTKEQINGCVPTKKFTDVKSTEWYAPYICVAKNEGVIIGFQDGTFKPKNDITFAEAAKIVSNSYGLKPVGEADTPDHWYLPFVDALYLKAAVPFSITDYTTPITRGEMAKVIFEVETETALEINLTVNNPVNNPVSNPADQTPPAPQDYKTSSSKSEITFSRVIDEIDDSGSDLMTYKLNINVKISGYLQEISPLAGNLNMVLDRVFAFKNSNVTWTITGSEKSEDDLCTHLWEITSSGSKSIGDLNVDTGDVKRTMTPVEGWGSWKLAYVKDGSYTYTPELSLQGQVLIPAVKTVTTTKMKPSAICRDEKGNDGNSVTTTNISLNPIFPLRFNNLNIDQSNHSGSLVADDDSSADDENANATFEYGTIKLPLDLPYDTGKWNISWNLKLP